MSKSCTGVDHHGSSAYRDCAIQSHGDAAIISGTYAQDIVSVLMIRKFENHFRTWHILRKRLIDERFENEQDV